MTHVLIENIAKYEGQVVTLKGWLANKRSSKALVFMQLRDGTGIIQAVVYRPELGDDIYALCDRMEQETCLAVTGLVKRDERSAIGYELSVQAVEVIGKPTEEYPITPKEHGVAFLMDLRHLWLRSKRQNAIMRIRNEVIRAIRDFFEDRNFVNLDAPIFMSSSCEGTSNLFECTYFDRKAYLSQ